MWEDAIQESAAFIPARKADVACPRTTLMCLAVEIVDRQRRHAFVGLPSLADYDETGIVALYQ